MRFIAAAAFACAAVFPSAALAAQDLVLDTGNYTHLADNTARNAAVGKGSPGLKGSHAFFKTTPFAATSWIAPNDYRNGEMHVVIDVLDKPSAAIVRLSVCMDDGGVSCVSQAEFTKTGRYMFARRPGESYSVNPNYARGFGTAAVILRDGGAADGKKLDLGQGFIGEPDFTRYFPLAMRVRAWLVTPGSTFVVPSDPPGGNDGGAESDGGDGGDSEGGDASSGVPGGPGPGATSSSGSSDDKGANTSPSGSRSSNDTAATGCTTAPGRHSAPPYTAGLVIAVASLLLAGRRRAVARAVG